MSIRAAERHRYPTDWTAVRVDGAWHITADEPDYRLTVQAADDPERLARWVAGLPAMLAAVLAIHRPVRLGWYDTVSCAECLEADDNGTAFPVQWPCETARAAGIRGDDEDAS